MSARHPSGPAARLRVGLVGTVLFVSACAATSDPERAAQSYREALARRDGRALHRVSAQSVREALDPEALEAFVEKNDATADRAVRALQPSPGEAVLRYPDGTALELRREEGRWRVVAGPMPLPLQDTPLNAVRTFLFAARGHLELLRDLLPEEAQGRYRTDAVLARRLEQIQPRVRVLRDHFSRRLPVHLEGDRAWIPFASGRRVRLVRQKDRWRILDLD